MWARQREGQRSPDGVVVGVAAGPPLRLVLEAAQAAGATLVGRAALGLSWLRLDGLSDDDAVARVTELRERLAPARSRSPTLRRPSARPSIPGDRSTRPASRSCAA